MSRVQGYCIFLHDTWPCGINWIRKYIWLYSHWNKQDDRESLFLQLLGRAWWYFPVRLFGGKLGFWHLTSGAMLFFGILETLYFDRNIEDENPSYPIPPFFLRKARTNRQFINGNNVWIFSIIRCYCHEVLKAVI